MTKKIFAILVLSAATIVISALSLSKYHDAQVAAERKAVAERKAAAEQAEEARRVERRAAAEANRQEYMQQRQRKASSMGLTLGQLDKAEEIEMFHPGLLDKTRKLLHAR